MGENSKIEWTDHTFNPWSGCSKVHAGCTHCYAEVNYSVKMRGVQWGPNGTRVMTAPASWREPLKWNRQAEAEGVRKRVFCASLADVFEDWQGPILGHKGRPLHHGGPWHVDDKYFESDLFLGRSLVNMDDLRRDLFALIGATPNLDWLLLTKRPKNIRRMWPCRNCHCAPCKGCAGAYDATVHQDRRPNVWLGTSISDQATTDALIPELLECRDLAPVLFVSAEPLLGPISFRWEKWKPFGSTPGEVTDELDGLRMIDWVICGGESGHHARPMNPEWVRTIRDQCQAAGVPFLFKQWGEWMPVFHGIDPNQGDPNCRIHAFHSWPNGERMWKVGKKAAGRLLDGELHDAYPEVQHVG